MIFELIKPGILENVIIKAQHNCLSDSRNYGGRFIPIVHEYVLLLRKETPLAVPLLITHRVEGDIRDMPGTTWRDIVAGVLEFVMAVLRWKRFITMWKTRTSKEKPVVERKSTANIADQSENI